MRLAWQRPPEHGLPVQLWPQKPQLLTSCVVSTHWPPHTIWGTGHTHCPVTHDVPGTVPQSWLHPPQLLLSMATLTQWPPQTIAMTPASLCELHPPGGVLAASAGASSVGPPSAASSPDE